MSDVTSNGESSRSRWRRVLALLQAFRLHAGLLVLASLATGIIEAGFLVAATRTGLAIANGSDQVALTRGFTMSVGAALTVAGVLIVARLIINLLAVRVQQGLSYRVTTSLRKQLADAFLRASWSVQQAQPAGALQSVVVNFPNQASGLLSTLVRSLSAMLSLAALLVVALLVDPPATLFVLVALVVLSAILGPLRRRIVGRSRVSVATQIEFANHVAEVGALGLEVQAFGVRSEATERLYRTIDDNAAATRRVNLLGASIQPIYVSMAYAAIIAGLAVVSGFGSASLDSVGAVMLLMLRSLGYGQELQNGSSAVANFVPFLEKLDGTLAEYRENAARWGSQSIATPTPLVLENVSFHYQSDRPVLTDVSLEVRPGEVLGVVGPSGAGKSTLIQLILGLRTPTEGTITAHGVALNDISSQSWTHHVAYVPQEPQLLGGTVADNIRFLRPHLSDADLVQAAKAAHIWDDIQRLPGGMDHHLGERGQQLSGGQRQRICIARALAGSPGLLVLDEPTSALDTVSETAIRNTISELKGLVSVVVIAHRPSTLEVCDRTIRIEGGTGVQEQP
jgi:ATP-binding cassette, subfamily B, bacterial